MGCSEDAHADLVFSNYSVGNWRRIVCEPGDEKYGRGARFQAGVDSEICAAGIDVALDVGRGGDDGAGIFFAAGDLIVPGCEFRGARERAELCSWSLWG